MKASTATMNDMYDFRKSNILIFIVIHILSDFDANNSESMIGLDVVRLELSQFFMLIFGSHRK